MNCKKGDMALVIGGHIDNIGKVVTCVELLGHGAFGVSSRTVIKPKDQRSMVDFWWKLDQDLELEATDESVYSSSAYPDNRLMPLRGDLLDDEENIRDKTPETV